MPQCVVIADDLTGGNATGVLLKQLNYRAITVLNTENFSPDFISSCDCVIYPTDSRAVSKEEAYKRVYDSTKLFNTPEVKVFSKRIDSTMRGNVGTEIDAMLDCLGSEYVAILAPAFPSSGRVVCGGYMLVNGVPLHKTDIAIDPKTPVKISEIESIIKEQSKYPIHTFLIKDLMKGPQELATAMLKAVKEGARILNFDCISQDDLDLIADACINARLKVVATDPGVFTATLTRKTIKPKEQHEKPRILAVVGTVHPLAKVQLDEFFLSQQTNHIVVNTVELIESEERHEAEIQRVVNTVLANYEKFSVSAVTGDGLSPEKRINFTPYLERYHCSLDDVTARINDAFGEITRRILDRAPAFRGIYSSGGDITVAVCRKVQTSGIDLNDEVLPLAAFGSFMDGPFKGVQIITKGGSQGKNNAISQCISYLKRSLYI